MFAFLTSRAFAPFAPVLLLVCSNVFMTFAWYGHLKFKDGRSTSSSW